MIKLNINWKKTFLITFDVLIACYLVMAFTSWNKPETVATSCTKVGITIADENENGFLNSEEIKKLLERNGLYPLNQPMNDINIRNIENKLMRMPFVKTAQCYATTEGHVCITVTQRTPIIRVKSNNGQDYYIDDNGGIMPNSQYTSDMIIVTGSLNQAFATRYIYLLAQKLMSSELWSNQVVQINVLPDKCIELVPRVGDHVVNIGALPTSNDQHKRETLVNEFVDLQLQRLETFYRLGLKEAGWKKYEYISLEFSNQIVCRRHDNDTPLYQSVQETAQQAQQTDNSDNNATPTEGAATTQHPTE